MAKAGHDTLKTRSLAAIPYVLGVENICERHLFRDSYMARGGAASREQRAIASHVDSPCWR